MGTLQTDRVVPHSMVVSAQTTRVPVINGHTETISVQFNKKPSLDELKAALRGFTGRPQQVACPSAGAVGRSSGLIQDGGGRTVMMASRVSRASS